jgi:hypothetical protein
MKGDTGRAMPPENVRVVERVRAAVVAAAAALVGVLALSAPAGAAPDTPFREVAVVMGARYVQSDGARFAWTTNTWGTEHGVVRVFDTLRGRSFRLEAPRPECSFGWIGGGLAVWTCVSPETMLLTNLSTGRSREPAGIDQVEQRAQPAYIFCRAWSIGRYWLGFSCGNGFGPGDDPFYLNHRTGRLTDYFDPFSPDLPFIDPDYVDLFRPFCGPLERPTDGSHAPPYFDYAPPFALHAPTGRDPRIDLIRLRRCGTKRAETLSRCRLTDCRTPQLGSRYVTWGEHKRVYAYLPRTRRRVLVGRAPTEFERGRKLSVAHTCNRVFALWGNTIYAARFEPREGAPRCQTAS